MRRTSLGKCLAGVPPALVEVKPTSLRGRMFPPLRVEIIDEFDKVEPREGNPGKPARWGLPAPGPV